MRGRPSLATILLWIAVVLLAASGSALAQTSFGSVNGTVTDATEGCHPRRRRHTHQCRHQHQDGGGLERQRILPHRQRSPRQLHPLDRTRRLQDRGASRIRSGSQRSGRPRMSTLQVGDVAETIEIVGGTESDPSLLRRTGQRHQGGGHQGPAFERPEFHPTADADSRRQPGVDRAGDDIGRGQLRSRGGNERVARIHAS